MVPVVRPGVVPVDLVVAVLAVPVVAVPVVEARVHRGGRVHPALHPRVGEPPARSLAVVRGLPEGLAVRVEWW